MILDCIVQGQKTSALIDTGAQVSLLSSELYSKLKKAPTFSGKLKLEGIIQDAKLEANLCEGVVISFNGNQLKFTWKFYVAPIKEPVILGIDFLCHQHAVLNFNKGTMTLGKSVIKVPQLRTVEGQQYAVCSVVVPEAIDIPPNSVLRTMATLSTPLKGDIAIVSSGTNRGLCYQIS